MRRGSSGRRRSSAGSATANGAAGLTTGVGSQELFQSPSAQPLKRSPSAQSPLKRHASTRTATPEEPGARDSSALYEITRRYEDSPRARAHREACDAANLSAFSASSDEDRALLDALRDGVHAREHASAALATVARDFAREFGEYKHPFRAAVRSLVLKGGNVSLRLQAYQRTLESAAVAVAAAAQRAARRDRFDQSVLRAELPISEAEIAARLCGLEVSFEAALCLCERRGEAERTLLALEVAGAEREREV